MDNIEQTMQDLKSLLSNLSCDLRTPLAIISGYGDVLLALHQNQGEIVLQDSFTRREALEKMARSGKYVTTIWEQYLDSALTMLKQEALSEQEEKVSNSEFRTNLSSLTANLGAEIRTPLTSVMGYTDLLLMLDSYEGVDGFNRKKILEQIRPAYEKINSLLELVFQSSLYTMDDNSSIE
jgi:signal transduction histidine kinase